MDKKNSTVTLSLEDFDELRAKARLSDAYHKEMELELKCELDNIAETLKVDNRSYVEANFFSRRAMVDVRAVQAYESLLKQALDHCISRMAELSEK